MALTAPTNDLTGNTIASTYDQLLIIDHADGIVEATLGTVSTQIGKSALSISDEHILIKGVDTNNAAGFEVQQTDGTSILKIAADTPAATLIGTLTVGADDAGHDVIFYGDTASSNMTWLTATDDLVLNDSRLYIDQDDDAFAIQIDSEATSVQCIAVDGKMGIYSEQTLSGGYAGYFKRDYNEAGSNACVTIIDDHVNNTQPAFKVYQDGAGYGIYIDHNANEKAIYIDHDGVTDEATMYFQSPVQTTGTVLRIDNCNALTTGRMMELKSNSSDAGTRDLVLIHNDHASATGATALKIQQDSTGPAISATGGIVEEGGVLKENLLTNSGFDVWSNSTLENVGSSFISGDNTDMDTQGDWVASSGDTTLSISSGELKVLNTKGSASHIVGAYLDVLDPNNVVTGKLYRINFDITSDGSMTENIKFSLAGTKMGDVPITAGKVSHSIVFEADTDAVYVTFIVNSSIDNAEFFLLDNVTLYEVTPGCVAADALACDGWVKSSTVDLFRQHSDSTYTKDGSFYSAKMTKGTNSLETVFTPLSAINDNSEYYKRYAGRTVTFGAWIYSLTASDNVKVSMYDDVTGYTLFSTYAGANAWEWQEVTLTVPSNITTFKPAIYLDGDSADVAYISQPMLVFGSSIGEGNYTRPHGEVIYFENQVTSNLLNNITSSSVAATALNVEADSNGVIPKGAKAINVFGRVRDSGSAGSDYISIYLKNDDTGDSIARFEVSGIANDRYRDTIQWQDCDADGDVHYVIDASGSDTLDTSMFNYCAVQLR